MTVPKNVRGTSISVNSFWKHYYGTRKVTAEQALRYEEVLGIPRSELRPDLWPPDEAKEGVNAVKA